MSEALESSSERDGTVDSGLAVRIASYRSLREQIERGIAPLATSIDGLSFEFQASLHGLALSRGGYVILGTDDGARLAQITDVDAVAETTTGDAVAAAGFGVLVRFARGSGVILDADASPFHDASVRPAEPHEVGAWFTRNRPARAGLTVGELLRAPGEPVTLDGGGLDRHTFVCGQSGSGKTYSLGLLLERVLAETSLRVVVLDPNSDYVGLGRLRSGTDPDLARHYAKAAGEVAVWGNDASADHPLRMRFADLDSAAQAAVLGLHPIRDREEYAVLADLLRLRQAGAPLITRAEQLLEAESPAVRQLGARAQNLGVLGWRLWSHEVPSIVDEVREPTARCVVVDLGSLDTMPEQRLVAEAVLSTLWGSRLSRRPCLVVVDEAHNICPANPSDEVSHLSCETAIQIAAEGRKYGLYLLTSTQRPHKVHENVVSQCDNLLLMRMNSHADLSDLARLFSFVPSGLMTGVTSFRMGQALVAGRFLPQAAYVQMGKRLSEEGGADIPATWAVSRTP